MKKLLLIQVIIFQLFFSAFGSSVKPGLDPVPADFYITLPGTNKLISLSDFLQLNARDYAKLTEKKLSLKDKFFFRITRKRLRRCIRKDGTVNTALYKKIEEEKYSFHTGGFFLGFLLSIPGLLVALLIDSGKKPKNVFISALFGCLVSPWSILLYLAILIAPK